MNRLFQRNRIAGFDLLALCVSNVVLDRGVPENSVYYIQKPFTRQDLAERTRTIPDEAGGCP